MVSRKYARLVARPLNPMGSLSRWTDKNLWVPS